MDIDFRCTKCGDCCRGLRLPLSVEEAIGWLNDGNPVEVLCEAIPWVDEPPAFNLVATFKRERSFPAISGELPIRVIVTLVAPQGSGCPNLCPDNQCGIYERRPWVCRTYPAEANPFFELIPERRRCPPGAWLPGGHPMTRQGAYVAPGLNLLIKSRLRQAVDDVPLHEALCQRLGIRTAAIANEGYVAHSPAIADLLDALSSAGKASPSSSADWEFVSDRGETVEAIRLCDARCLHASNDLLSGFVYLSLFEKTM